MVNCVCPSSMSGSGAVLPVLIVLVESYLATANIFGQQVKASGRSEAKVPRLHFSEVRNMLPAGEQVV